MQTIKLKLNHFNFYCPTSGEPVISENKIYNQTAKSLVGFWIDQLLDSPHFNNSELLAEWKESLAIFAVQSNGDVADKAHLLSFLQKSDHPNWVAFQIETIESNSDAASNTAWYVIDMDSE